MIQAIAILCLALPVIAFVGYPLIVIVAAPFVARRTAPVTHCPPPSIGILIGAYNEAPRIAAKLESVLRATDTYPGPVDIIVGDDGSDDPTATIVEGFAARGVRLVRRGRGGKAAVLNAIAPMIDAEILVLTDADPVFAPDTLSALVADFNDPAVGAVAGRVETRGGGRFAVADRIFRAYESRLRESEDRLFGCVSADGGLFAIRSSLMPQVPGDVTDDFYISTAAVAAGYRIAFADDARVYETSIAGADRQFRRRVRITVRGLAALWSRRALMNPARTGWYAIGLIGHKLARRLAPLPLVPLWFASAWLALGGDLFWALVCLGLTGVALAGLAAMAPVRLPRGLSTVQSIALHLGGLGIGLILFARGRRYAQWTPQKEA